MITGCRRHNVTVFSVAKQRVWEVEREVYRIRA
jgi:hypothetical protein